MKIKEFKDGEVIFREGAQEDFMYDIYEGSVDVFLGYGTPEEKKLVTLACGEVFGEMGFIEKKARSATAVAVGNVKLSMICEEDLAAYVKEQPLKVLRIMRQTSTRTRKLSKDYVEVAETISDYLKAEEAGEKVPSEVKDRMKSLLEKVQ